MPTTYTKSLSSDFGGNLQTTQLQKEINSDGAISHTCIAVLSRGTDVQLIFDTALDGAEQTALNAVVAAHTPATAVGANTAVIAIEENDVSNINYQVLRSFEFAGESFSDVTHFKVVAQMGAGGTSYDIRIYDITNNYEICKNNFTNETMSVCDLGSLSNIPSGSAIFEIQCRVVGVTEVDIKSLNINHNW